MCGKPSQDSVFDAMVDAFPTRPVPMKAELIPKIGYRDDEREEIATFLDGKIWTDLNRAIFRQYKWDTRAILPLLSDSGLKYYFPAFLRAGVDDYLECTQEFTSALNQFVQTSSPDIELRKQRRIEQFSERQLKAIRLAFEFVQSNYSHMYDPFEASEIDIAVERLSDMISGKPVG